VRRLRVHGCSPIARTTRHGFPAANTPSGPSRITTLPAPITDRDRFRTPGRMIAPPPTQTSDPISGVQEHSAPRKYAHSCPVLAMIDRGRDVEHGCST